MARGVAGAPHSGGAHGIHCIGGSVAIERVDRESVGSQARCFESEYAADADDWSTTATRRG
eukprot:2260996-Pyramimonas_sp.AAC.1